MFRNLTTTDARARVATGAAHLDTVAGPTWSSRIDLTTFDLPDPCFCVLGQLYGNYYTARDDQRETNTRRGFTIEGTHDDWITLQDAWIELIRARQTADQDDSPTA